MKSSPLVLCSETIFREGPIEGVIIKPLKRFTDERGWLTELFRHDQLDEEFYPQMAYISMTRPGVQRGPHEHQAQADLFFFLGPSRFLVKMWDNRPASPTYRRTQSILAGDVNPVSIIIPAGVVHAYRNEGDAEGIVINSPNRLYRGPQYSEPIDEIRHEDDPNTRFQMDNE